MARLTKAQREWHPDKPRKRRSIKVMFGSTVLALEAFVVFFATLVAFGIEAQGLPPAVLLTCGIALSGVLVAACALLAKSFGDTVGWLLQVLLIATGFIVPMMFLVGVLFALTWWYGIHTGARLDRENARRDAAQAEWERDHPEPGN
ncbi:DUF4233 domain-containing protein [Arthrobacter castelli]|uniref:DUF4233 domain-containing protein n=1 Tax=Arthrobacter castelli TaxID=271431 RepID=UPI00040CEE65|nr:DUF4233 domain-containing protein [Arthrobacter castelli]